MRRGRFKEEPIPGRKSEKRKKRRWDRTPEVIEDYKYGRFEIDWTVPHLTFRDKPKR
jgi:hypothetical protein